MSSGSRSSDHLILPFPAPDEFARAGIDLSSLVLFERPAPRDLLYAEHGRSRICFASRWGADVSPAALAELAEDAARRARLSRVPAPTGPGAIAERLWTSTDGGHFLHGGPNDFRTRFIRQAVYGGRAEAIRTGTFAHAWRYDLNSAYLAAALAIPRWPLRPRYVRPPDVGLIWSAEGVAEAVVEQSGFLPFLPRRCATGVDYPVGRFTGVWTHLELRAAAERGVRIIELRRQYVAEEHLPGPDAFGRFVELVARAREDAPAELRSLWKRIGVALFGRLAVISDQLLRFRPTDAFPDGAQWIDRIGDQWFAGAAVPARARGNPLWAAMVLSQARIWLWDAAILAGDDLLYLDTDCVVASRPLDLPVGGEMGRWRLDRGEIEIRGAKAYRWRALGEETDRIVLRGAPAAVAPGAFFAARATSERVRLPDGRSRPPRAWCLGEED